MATKLTANYLKTVFDFDIKERLRCESLSVGLSIQSILNHAYDDMYLLAKQDDCRVTCLADMEARLDTEEKKDFFLKAQGYHVVYQFNSGKNSLILPENFDLNAKAWDYCGDTLRIMRGVLDFNRPTPYTKRR